MKARHAQVRGAHGAFTLIEVLLAIVIVTGLLSVALFFYQQAAQFRTDLLQETERVSAARLLMDRITSELRCARPHSYYEVPLAGDASSIQFITTSLPTRASWSGESMGRLSRPETDLKFVKYGVLRSEGETNATGVTRSEEPLVSFRSVSPVLAVTVEAASQGGETNQSTAVLLTDQLRGLHFRYWDGSAWQSSWNSTRLPAAVEITLSADALPDAVEGEPLVIESDEVFRRVIYLPGSAAPAPRATASGTNGTLITEELL